MKLQELHRIKDSTLKNFNSIPSGVRLEDMNRDLDSGELIAISYYNAVVQHLITAGLLQNDGKTDIVLVSVDSAPPEEDYL